MNNVPDMVKRGDLASQTNNNIDEEEQEKFFVEKVMRASKKGKEEFLVKWAGYPLSQATWESIPESMDLKDECSQLKCSIVTSGESKMNDIRNINESECIWHHFFIFFRLNIFYHNGLSIFVTEETNLQDKNRQIGNPLNNNNSLMSKSVPSGKKNLENLVSTCK